MDGYYSDKLAAEKLRKCYEIAPARVQQYLNAEIQYVLSRSNPTDIVLEMGCGYGRILGHLCSLTRTVIGIDTSLSSLILAREELKTFSNIQLLHMDAVALAFPDNLFNLVLCVQNGISAFKVNQIDLMKEAVRVTGPGGKAVFSSYSGKFWDDRLEWFRLQSEAGLLGEIDYDQTGNGVIICKDGFRATTVLPEQFEAFASQLNLNARIFEVDNSSIFCEISK